MKKRLFTVILALALVVALVACNPITDEDLLDFSEKNEAFSSALSDFKDHCNSLLEEEDEIIAATFNMDIVMADAALVTEAFQYLAIALYNSSGRAYDEATGLSGISKIGDTYTLTYEDNKTVVFKTSENSSQYDSFAEEQLEVSIQKLFLGENEFAVQFVSFVGEDGYEIWQIYINGTSGRVAAGKIAQTAPASIYNNPASITEDFATGGERNYVITEDSFTHDVEFEN
jgi:uncharacterized lipoprotein YehR (DUF1307 family)